MMDFYDFSWFQGPHGYHSNQKGGSMCSPNSLVYNYWGKVVINLSHLQF